MKKELISVLLLCSIISLTGCNAHRENVMSSDAEDDSVIQSELPNEDITNDETPENVVSDNPSLIEPVEESKSVQINYIDGEFMDTSGYGDGLAAVQDSVSGLWGYIDKTGNYIIQPQYAYAYPFSEGRAAVNIGNNYSGCTWGFIDKENNMVIEAKYSEPYNPFKDGCVSVQSSGSEWHVIDYNGNEIVKATDEVASTSREGYGVENMGSDYHVIASEENKTDCVMDSNGKLVLDLFQVSNDEKWCVRYLLENAMVVEKEIGNVTISALIDYNGNMLMDFKYKELKPFKGGYLFLARQADDTAFLVDRKGDVIRELGSVRSMSSAKYYSSKISVYGLSYYDTDYALDLYQSIEVIDNQSGEIIHNVPVEEKSLEYHFGSYLFFENCYVVYAERNTWVDGFCKVYDYDGNLLLDYGTITLHLSPWPFGNGSIEDVDDILLPQYNREKKSYSFLLIE